MNAYSVNLDCSARVKRELDQLGACRDRSGLDRDVAAELSYYANDCAQDAAKGTPIEQRERLASGKVLVRLIEAKGTPPEQRERLDAMLAFIRDGFERFDEDGIPPLYRLPVALEAQRANAPAWQADLVAAMDHAETVLMRAICAIEVTGRDGRPPALRRDWLMFRLDEIIAGHCESCGKEARAGHVGAILQAAGIPSPADAKEVRRIIGKVGRTAQKKQ